MISVLEVLQSDITAKLNSEAFYVDITVNSVRKYQIASDVAQSMPQYQKKNDKVGVGVFVGMPTVDVEHPDVPGPQLLVTLPIRIHEDPTINLATNGTKKSAETVAMDVLQTLHGYCIDGVGSLYGPKDAITPSTEFEGLVTYDVFLKLSVAQSSPEKVLDPDVSENALSITLTNRTADAIIYYTTDGSFPGSDTATATIYTVPFMFAGTALRVAAYKTGMKGSDAKQYTIS